MIGEANSEDLTITLGVEEEFFLVDPGTCDLLIDPDQGIFDACETNSSPHKVVREFFRSQIVCGSVAEVRTALRETRRTVIEAAERYGATVMAASTHPFAAWKTQSPTPQERYERFAIIFQETVRRFVVGACRLARDYPKEFHLQVLGLLSALVRYPPPIPVEIFGVTEDGHPRTPVPREEVQTILVFLGGRTAEGREIEKAEGYTIDLNGSKLCGVQPPPGSNLEGVSLQGTDLTGAFFDEVKGLTQDQIYGALNDPSHRAIFLDTEDAETGKSLTVLQKA